MKRNSLRVLCWKNKSWLFLSIIGLGLAYPKQPLCNSASYELSVEEYKVPRYVQRGEHIGVTLHDSSLHLHFMHFMSTDDLHALFPLCFTLPKLQGNILIVYLKNSEHVILLPGEGAAKYRSSKVSPETEVKNFVYMKEIWKCWKLLIGEMAWLELYFQTALTAVQRMKWIGRLWVRRLLYLGRKR